MIGSEDRGPTDMWTTSDVYYSFGSASDLWNETWTVADINASDFGYIFQISGQPSGTASVDHVRITVHYTEAGAEDTCTYSGTGDWNVNYSDNCVATTTTWVKGDFNLNYDGAGSFSLRALLQVDDMNVGAGASISAENSTAQIEIY